MNINTPTHHALIIERENKTSGRSATRQAKDGIYLNQSWIRRDIAEKHNTRLVSTFVPDRNKILAQIAEIKIKLGEASRWTKPEHVATTFEEVVEMKIKQGKASRYVKPINIDARFQGETDIHAEFEALIDDAMANQQPRRKLKPVIVKGICKTIVEHDLPIKTRPKTVAEFLTAFPSYTKAVAHIAGRI